MGDNEYIDYYVIHMVFASAFSGKISTAISVLKDEIDESHLDEQKYFQRAAKINSQNFATTVVKDGAEVDMYTGNPKYCAVTEQQKKDVNEVINEFSDGLNNLVNNKNVKKYEAITHYFQSLQKMIDSAKKGVDRFSYTKRIPGAVRILGSPDWLDKDFVTEKPINAQQFNDMLIGMKFDEYIQMIDKRIDMAMEMDSKSLSPGEKSEYAKEIRKLNDKLIANCEHQMSDETALTYRNMYQNYDGPTGSINGGRGYKTDVQMLKDENAAIGNGWDITRLADYHIMKKLTDECRDALDKLAGEDDPALADIKQTISRLAELDPKGKIFENQMEFDKYCISFNLAAKRLYEQMLAPENNKLMNSLAARKEEQRMELFSRMTSESGMDAFRQLVNRTDLANEPTFGSEKRMDEIEAAKLEYLNDGVDDIRRQAKEKLQYFKESLDGERKNSGHYNKMRDALEKLANLPDTCTMQEMKDALNKLDKASANYIKKRKGAITSSGKRRLAAAQELISLAKAGVPRADALDRRELDLGIDRDLNRDIQDALELDYEPVQDKNMKELKERLEKDFRTKSKKEFDGAGSNNMDLQDDYTRALSRCIAHASVSMDIKRGKEEYAHTTSAVESRAKQIEKSPVFKAMVEEAKKNPDIRKELSELSSSELFAKLATKKQTEKQKEAEAKRAPKALKQADKKIENKKIENSKMPG